ncbi:MAG: hypothetical protein EHM28_07515 [Spirochaetaceae bacterium]|nr:MAG: hypothetical protein EHM28_07515 [Spirochaetaceae bacterium]
MELASMDEFFKRPRSMVAIQAGTRVLIPWLPFTMFTFQYTKIEPFVYAHYPENRISSSRYDVDMSYTHDGENLGYALPPNSDEFLAKLDTVFTNGIQASLSYRLIRHGTNTYNPAIPLIYGDVNAWFDYDMVDAYPDKRFLSDGYYDWNNVITISGTWKIPGTPVTVSLSYSFCHTFWDMNETGVAQIDTQLKNIFSVRVRVF